MVDNFDDGLGDSQKSFRVVAALIRRDGKVLLTQRWPGKHLALTWEFPGGKVEAGEADEEALQRELKEELGIDAKVGACCFETRHGYGNREVHLLIYRCEIMGGAPKAIDVKAVEWAEEKDLLSRSFPPADLLLVQEIVAGRIGSEFQSFDQEDDDEDMPVFKPAQVVRRPVAGKSE